MARREPARPATTLVLPIDGPVIGFPRLELCRGVLFPRRLRRSRIASCVRYPDCSKPSAAIFHYPTADEKSLSVERLATLLLSHAGAPPHRCVNRGSLSSSLT